MEEAPFPRYRFGEVEIDFRSGSVRRAGVDQHLRHKTFLVLRYLIENRDRIVTKQEVLDGVWNGAAVTEGTLVQSIVDIRRAVGDDPRDPWFVKTIAKTGYRVVAEGSEMAEAGEVREIAAAPVSRRPLARSIAAMTVAAIAIVAVSLYLQRRASADTAIATPAVAVMVFENPRKQADVAWLREALPDMLITGITRASNVRVISRRQLATIAQRLGATSSKAGGAFPAALAIAREANANRIISGSFSSSGGAIRIDAQLHDVASGELLGSESLVTPAGELLTRIDTLSTKLGARLARNPAIARGHMRDMMTADLEAYRLYTEGVERAQRLDNPAAIRLFEQAIARDPDFAMAYARIGYVYAVTWHLTEKARPYLERAWQRSGSLSPGDRLSIAAWRAIANGQYQAAIDHYRARNNLYPNDAEACHHLAKLLWGEERFEEAIAVARDGLVIDPSAPSLHNVLGLIYATLGRYAEAIEAHERYVALRPNEANAHDSLGMSYEAAGDYGAALRAYRRALEIDPKLPPPRAHLGNVLYKLGRYRDAIEQFEIYLQDAPGPGEQWRGLHCLAWIHLSLGDVARAEHFGRRAVAVDRSAVFMLYLVTLAKGDEKTATALLPAHDESYGRYNGRGQRPFARFHYYMLVKGALSRRSYDEAIEIATRMLRHQRALFYLDELERTLGDVYLAAAKAPDAAREYERVLRINPNDAITRYRLGLALEQIGRVKEAREQYRRFVQLWSGADADIPELRDARKRLRG